MGITATRRYIGMIQFSSDSSIHVRFDGVRHQISSWREVESADGAVMVEATMWAEGSRFPRVEIIEQTW